LVTSIPAWGQSNGEKPAATPAPTPKPKPSYIDSRIDGVQVGIQSYSLRDRKLDEAILAMAALGIGACELWQGHVEPAELSKPNTSREDLRRWRMSVPLEDIAAIRDRFDAAGVELIAYNLSFRSDFTDAEMERSCLMAKALGVPLITASANISAVRRFDRFAYEHGLRVGLHNHSHVRPDEIATPDDFRTALTGVTSSIGINLDLGHFTAAGFDCLAFIEEHHKRIYAVHLKDRKRDQGPNVPWGEGDTPLADTLRLLRDKRWPIPAMIEYEYKAKDTIDEVKRCLAYCRTALEG
jgi:sugar phosphate isomerase/epimerase